MKNRSNRFLLLTRSHIILSILTTIYYLSTLVNIKSMVIDIDFLVGGLFIISSLLTSYILIMSYSNKVYSLLDSITIFLMCEFVIAISVLILKSLLLIVTTRNVMIFLDVFNIGIIALLLVLIGLSFMAFHLSIYSESINKYKKK